MINIYPLESAEMLDTRKADNAAIPPMCKSILDIVSVDSEADPRINHLLKNTFGGSVLVKDFKSAL